MAASRIFNQSKGRNSGFVAGEEEIYNVFSRLGEVGMMCLRVPKGPVRCGQGRGRR